MSRALLVEELERGRIDTFPPLELPPFIDGGGSGPPRMPPPAPEARTRYGRRRPPLWQLIATWAIAIVVAFLLGLAVGRLAHAVEERIIERASWG